MSQRNTYKKVLSEPEALKKAMKYCAYQERCEKDLSNALKNWNVPTSYHDSIIDELVENDFLNEKRFAEAFVKGKFGLKKWGRVKIEYELKIRDIDNELIKNAMGKIDERNYSNVAQKLIKKKLLEYKGVNSFQLKSKILWYMVGKGYEKELVFKQFKKLNV